jgi:sodium/potassium-transporting ATPase subunit alpha
MKINSLSRDQILQGLVTSDNGLTEDEARRRLAEFGPNEITGIKKRSLFLRFLNQLTHFLALLLWFAALLSFLSEYLHPGEGMFSLGIAITTVILINAVLRYGTDSCNITQL